MVREECVIVVVAVIVVVVIVKVIVLVGRTLTLQTKQPLIN